MGIEFVTPLLSLLLCFVFVGKELPGNGDSCSSLDPTSYAYVLLNV